MGQEGRGLGRLAYAPVIWLKQAQRPLLMLRGPRFPGCLESAVSWPCCTGARLVGWSPCTLQEALLGVAGGGSPQLASPPAWHRDSAACPGCGEGRPPPAASWVTHGPVGGEARRRCLCQALSCADCYAAANGLRGRACQGSTGKWAEQRADTPTSLISLSLRLLSVAPDFSQGRKTFCVSGGS